MSYKKCCCTNEKNTKRTVRNDKKLDNWTLRNNSTQVNAILTPEVYEDSCDSDEKFAPKNEVTKTKTKIKWESPYKKHSLSKYHQKCFTKKVKKFPKTKLKKSIIPSQFCRNSSPSDVNRKFINECYCCSAPNKPLLPKKPDLVEPGSRSDNCESPYKSESTYSLETLQKAKDLIDYSPESKFLKRLRKEAQEVYDCKCLECKLNKENANMKFTDRRRFLEDAYKNVDDYKQFDFDALSRKLHQCRYKSKKSPKKSPKPHRQSRTSPRLYNPKYTKTSPERIDSPLYPRRQSTHQSKFDGPSSRPSSPYCYESSKSSRRNSPSGDRNSPSGDRNSLCRGRDSPCGGRYSRSRERNSPCRGRNFPSRGRNSPCRGRNFPSRGRNFPSSGRNSPSSGRNSPGRGRNSPSGSSPEFSDYEPSTKFKNKCDCYLASDSTRNDTSSCNCYPHRTAKKSLSNRSSSNYCNRTASKHKAPSCEKIKSIQTIRTDNYFECHSTAHLSPTRIPKHQCVHKFTLDDRLLPKPENADAFGFSRCTICNKPMENKLKTQNQTECNSHRSPQSISRRSSATLKYSYTAPRQINIGSKNDVIELKVPPSLLENDKVYRFKNRIVPEDTWALRYQKGVI